MPTNNLDLVDQHCRDISGWAVTQRSWFDYMYHKIQKYLTTDKMSQNTKRVLFRARTRMLNVQSNYGKHTPCPLCKMEEDSQQHLLECLIIKINNPDILNNVNSIYEDIYSNNIDKQNNITKLIEMAINSRKIILKQ